MNITEWQYFKMYWDYWNFIHKSASFVLLDQQDLEDVFIDTLIECKDIAKYDIVKLFNKKFIWALINLSKKKRVEDSYKSGIDIEKLEHLPNNKEFSKSSFYDTIARILNTEDYDLLIQSFKMTQQEIADKQGVSLRTIERRLHKIRDILTLNKIKLETLR